MTQYNITSGVTSSGITLNVNDDLSVSAGGKAIAITVDSLGNASEYVGGVASGTVLSSGGKEYVEGGLASGTVVSTGGQQYVESGGTASGTVVSNGGLQFVDRLGTADNTTVDSGGVLLELPGSHVNGSNPLAGSDVITVPNSAVLLVSASNAVSMGVGTVSGYNLGYQDIEYVFSGGTAVDSMVTDDSFQYISSGGVAVGTVINNGVEFVSSGGLTSGTVLESHGQEFVYTGLASGTVVSSGGNELVIGGRVTNTVVSIGGTESVGFGGTAVDTVVSSGGTEFTFASGVASDTTVIGGGVEVVTGGGITSDTTIDAGGTLLLWPGAQDPGLNAVSGSRVVALPHSAILLLSPTTAFASSGVASGDDVGSGATEYIYSGGTAIGSLVHDGGFEQVSAGGTAIGAVLTSGGNQMVNGGTISNTVIRAGGYNNVFGTAVDTVVSFGGAQFIEGGIITGTIVSSGGFEETYGGIASGTVVRSGGRQVVDGNANGVAGTVVLSGGAIELPNLIFSSGGSAVLDPVSDVLTVTEGTASLQLQLSGSYANSYFQVAANSLSIPSGTLLTLNSTGASTWNWVGGTLNVASPSDWALAGGPGNVADIPASGDTANNNGTLAGFGLIAASLINEGTIEATNNSAPGSSTGGDLEIEGAITGTGSMTIEPGATLQIDGTLGSGQSIVFAPGAPETLILGSPTGTISNPITGFTLGDKLEFSNIANVESVSFVNGDTLAVTYVNAAGSIGVYDLTNVSIAASTPLSFLHSIDVVTGYRYVLPTTILNWTGASSTDFSTAANWNLQTIVPSEANYVNFNNGIGGTISGTGTVQGFNFNNSGTWTLAPGTSLSFADTIFIGNGGGGTPTDGALTIGGGSTITSPGGLLNVGGSGDTVTLTVSGGGVFRETAADALPQVAMDVGNGGASGLLAPANATAVVTGSGSLIDLGPDSLEIGNLGGTGNVTVSAGGSIVASTPNSTRGAALFVGRLGSGTLTVTDPGSQVTANGLVNVAAAQTGALIVENFGSFLAAPDPLGVAGLFIGEGQASDVGGTGSATVTTDGVLDSQGYIAVGIRGTAGQLNVLNGGTVEVGTTLTVGAGGTLSNGTTESGNGTLTIGASGTVELTGGAQTATYGAIFGNANNGLFSATTTGAATVSGTGALLNTDGNGIAIGQYGSAALTVSQGGSIVSGAEDSNLISALAIGRQGDGIVTVTDHGSRFTADGAAYVGRAGNGSLIVENQGSVVIGLDGLGAGGLDIGGGGTATGGTLYLGGTGSATVTSGGGLSSLANIIVGENGDTGTLAISGATVTASGQLSIGKGTTLAAGGVLISPTGTTTVTSPTMETGTGSVTVGAGGVLTVDQSGSSAAAIVLGDVAGSVGTLTVASGGTVNAGGGLSLFQNSTVSVAVGGGIAIGGSGALTATAAGETISNLGTIGGSVSLAGGDRLVTGAGAVFNGAITGGTGGNTLEIASGPYLLVNFDAPNTPQYSTLQIDNGVSVTTDASDVLTGLTLINNGTLNLGAFESTTPVQNSGEITGDITLAGGVPLINTASGTISGSGLAVIEALGPVSVMNSGVIDPATYGVDLIAGGSVTNAAGGTIEGTVAGVLISGGAGTVTNGGLISGGGVDAVTLAAGFANRVILDPGAMFTGIVDGGNTIGAGSARTLELAATPEQGTLTGFGSEFINFAQIVIDPGASWAFLGTNTLATGTTLTDQGTLLVNATTVTGGSVTVDSTAGTPASAVVEGGGSWSGTSAFVVGATGAGALLINTAGTLSAAGEDVAQSAGSSGTITVSGTNSLLSDAGSFVVGDAGLGNLSVDASGSVTALSGLTIANASGASGSSVNVSGAGSDLAVTGTLIVGSSGYGSLSLSQGATVTASSLDVAAASSGDGAISIAGAGTTLDIAGSLTLGDQAAGELSILGGAQMTIAGGVVGGSGIDGTGNLDIEDAGSTLTINGGTLLVGANGPAEFTLGIGGTLDGEVSTEPNGVTNLYGNVDPATLLNDGAENIGNSQGGTSQSDDFYIANSGTITIKGTATFYTPLVTFETAAADGSTTGLWVIAAKDTLVMNAASADASQTFDFTSATAAELVIGQVPSGPNINNLDTLVQNGTTMTTPFLTASPVLGASALLNGGWAAPIENYQVGDTIVLQGLTYGSASASGDVVTVWSGEPNVSNALGSLVFVDKSGSTTSAASLAEAAAAAAQITPLPCFAAGTRIATADGLVKVERLAVGDRVRTVLGGVGSAGSGRDWVQGGVERAGLGGPGRAEARADQYEPIVWVGSRAVNCVRHPKPETVWPVRVRAGAFGENVPVCDLYLSPDHAVYVDGVLVPVKLLVNGTSIAQVKRKHVVYYHVELPEHAVILAEGLTVESYLDTGDRANFSGSETIRLYPDFAARLDAAMTWETKGAAPLVMVGEELARARRAVVETAPGSGFGPWKRLPEAS